MNILVTHAIPEERVNISFPDCTIRYVETGIGKVNAVLNVNMAIQQSKPDLIMNVGTAGSSSHPVDKLVLCGRFLDRDMEKVKEFGVAYQYDFTEQLAAISLLSHLDYAAVCNTGDSFVMEWIPHADVVDMEAFAIAALCQRERIPLMSVKYVTDQIGQNSPKHWQEKLADANMGLQNFFDQWRDGLR